jgi:carbon storage regulator
MLILSRKIGERILIGDDIVLKVLDSGRSGVRFGLEAPKQVAIQREELVPAAAGPACYGVPVLDGEEYQKRRPIRKSR